MIVAWRHLWKVAHNVEAPRLAFRRSWGELRRHAKRWLEVEWFTVKVHKNRYNGDWNSEMLEVKSSTKFGTLVKIGGWGMNQEGVCISNKNVWSRYKGFIQSETLWYRTSQIFHNSQPVKQQKYPFYTLNIYFTEKNAKKSFLSKHVSNYFVVHSFFSGRKTKQ